MKSNDSSGRAPASNEGRPAPARRKRADGLLNLKSLLEAAAHVFAAEGVDAPVRSIAERAQVGLGTVYRHFPQRSDLIKAVFQSQVDACADAATQLSQRCPPMEALERWMRRYVEFIATKRGLASALHSGEPAYSTLPELFQTRMIPALAKLLDEAVADGVVRSGVDPEELLIAVATLCRMASGTDLSKVYRMVRLMVDGLRCQK